MYYQIKMKWNQNLMFDKSNKLILLFLKELSLFLNSIPFVLNQI